MRCKLKDFCTVINGRAYSQKELLDKGKYRVLRVGNFFSSDRWYFSDLELPAEKYCNKGDLLFAWACSFGPRIWDGEDRTIFHYHIWKLDIDSAVVDKKYLYYLLKISVESMTAGTHGSVMMHITKSDMENFEFDIPTLEVQKKIAAILSALDEKIATNRAINENLERQLTALFIHDFADGIAAASTDTCPMLGDLITVIDNRGKTPPLTTEIFDYPIIDVGALKGSGRIVDFNNCTKYVEQATYETWFRSGHPKSWDILISTVGSLAEMKIYLGAKGCMAQNVVALRATSISPLYLYQYLRFIRADLVAYNIGSVQPSIKVTHIVKHPIFVPEFSKLQEFEATAMAITNYLYANYNECESLKELRDTLLPKLMSGEIDVSAVQL